MSQYESLDDLYRALASRPVLEESVVETQVREVCTRLFDAFFEAGPEEALRLVGRGLQYAAERDASSEHGSTEEPESAPEPVPVADESARAPRERDGGPDDEGGDLPADPEPDLTPEAAPAPPAAQ